MWSTSALIDQSIAALLFVALLGSAVDVSEIGLQEPPTPLQPTLAEPVTLEATPLPRSRSGLTESAWAAPLLSTPTPLTSTTAPRSDELPSSLQADRSEEGSTNAADTESPAATAVPQPSTASSPAPTASPAAQSASTTDDAELAEIESLIKQIELELDSLEALDPLSATVDLSGF